MAKEVGASYIMCHQIFPYVLPEAVRRGEALLTDNALVVHGENVHQGSRYVGSGDSVEK